MKNVNYLKNILLIFLLLSIYSHAHSEVIILSNCKNEKDTFKKNEYILDLEKLLMTRNFIYSNKSYKKYKLTDLSIKKKI